LRPEEFPPSLDEGTTWLDWTGACLKLTQEQIDEGGAKIEWPEGSSKSVFIPIIQDLADTQAKIKERKSSLIEVPENFEPSDLPKSLRPLRVEDQEHIFSVSEIESYIQCPQKYYDIYKIGRLDRDITTPAIGENAVTKGLIIHEVFQGKDPATVLRSYGISDSKKVELYEGLYRRFMSSVMMGDVLDEYKELPFRVKINDIPFAGKIDRLIKKADGSWNIIDYKTTQISEDEIGERIKQYILQLTVYRKAMELLLKQDVGGFVYFTSLGGFAEVKGNEPKILEDIQRAIGMIKSGQFSFDGCAGCNRKQADWVLKGSCPSLRMNFMAYEGE